jgi:hypothetical protein
VARLADAILERVLPTQVAQAITLCSLIRTEYLCLPVGDCPTYGAQATFHTYRCYSTITRRVWEEVRSFRGPCCPFG